MRHYGFVRTVGRFLFFWFVIVSADRVVADPPALAKPSAAAIAELMKQLASSDEASQKSAAARLETLPEAIPALRKVVESPDLGLHWRAEACLREVLLRKTRSMLDRYPIDMFLEHMLRTDDRYDEEAYYRVAAEFAGRIVDAAKRDFKNPPKLTLNVMPVYDFIQYRKDLHWDAYAGTFGGPSIVGPKQQLPKLLDSMGVFRRDSLDFPFGSTQGFSLLTTPGSLRTDTLSSSVALVGNRAVFRNLNSSILVADGEVVASDGIGFSIVLTRGSITSERDIKTCIVLAGGTVEFGKNGRNENSTIRENTPKLLGWVRFFELIDAGIDVTAAQGGVAVAKLTDALPPAKAGLKVGDVITAVDGKPAKDPETFRRLLRRGTVMDQTVFTVKRGGKDVPVTASYLGWEPPVLKPAK